MRLHLVQILKLRGFLMGRVGSRLVAELAGPDRLPLQTKQNKTSISHTTTAHIRAVNSTQICLQRCDNFVGRVRARIPPGRKPSLPPARMRQKKNVNLGFPFLGASQCEEDDASQPRTRKYSSQSEAKARGKNKSHFHAGSVEFFQRKQTRHEANENTFRPVKLRVCVNFRLTISIFPERPPSRIPRWTRQDQLTQNCAGEPQWWSQGLFLFSLPVGLTLFVHSSPQIGGILARADVGVGVADARKLWRRYGRHLFRWGCCGVTYHLRLGVTLCDVQKNWRKICRDIRIFYKKASVSNR